MDPGSKLSVNTYDYTARFWPWWLSPGWLVASFLLPIYGLTIFYLSMFGETTAIRQAGFIPTLDTGYELLGAACLTCFACGGLLAKFAAKYGGARKFSVSTTRSVDFKVFLLLFSLTMVGYAFFFVGALREGGVAMALKGLQGDASSLYAIRSSGRLIPGVSSLTQLGPALVVFRCIAPPTLMSERRWSNRAVVTIILLSALRVILWSERLAIIEIVLPACIAIGVRQGFSRRKLRWVTVSAPFLAIGLLIVGFGSLETIRSWKFYEGAYNGNWLEFVVDRLGLYYGLSLSNGMRFLIQIPGYLGHLNFTLDWFYKIPFLNQLPWAVDYQQMAGLYWNSLSTYGAQEFNNESGLFPYIYDYGTFSVIVFGMAGFLSEGVFLRAKRGSILDLSLFPFIYLALVEILREPYITSSRMFYLFLGLAALIVTSRRQGVVLKTGANTPAQPSTLPTLTLSR